MSAWHMPPGIMLMEVDIIVALRDIDRHMDMQGIVDHMQID